MPSGTINPSERGALFVRQGFAKDNCPRLRLRLRGGCDASAEVGQGEMPLQEGTNPDQMQDDAENHEAKHLSAAVSMSKMVFNEEDTGEIGYAGIRIRQAGVWDVLDMKRINLVCLPENYQTQYFWYHILRWPSLAFVAEAPVNVTNQDAAPWRVIGYVLGKMDDDEMQDASASGVRGHITSLAVMKTHRRKQVAKRLMLASTKQMAEVHGALTCSLHVRSGNEAALRLYRQTLGFQETKREQASAPLPIMRFPLAFTARHLLSIT